MARSRNGYQTPKLPPLVGVKDACELLGVQKMTFNRWRQDGYFDVPSADPGPSQGPVWVEGDVIAWRDKHGRKRAAVAASD